MPKPSDTVSLDTPGSNRRTLNGALRGARNTTMLSLIGNPRGNYDKTCRQPTNGRILALMKTASFGPFRATGILPAVETLQNIMADIRSEEREVHDALSTAGMLCCRLVRGSATSISNHSWGTAIDLKLDGKLDKRGDGRAQRGLLKIHPIFNRHGFYWGAAFRTEDAMHFEASDQLVREWADEGRLGDVPQVAAGGLLTLGDRGPEVEELQDRLNFALGLDIDADGIFGNNTRATVIEFQRQNGLAVDGVAGPNTLKVLKEATAAHDI